MQHEELGGFLDGVCLASEKRIVQHLALETLPLLLGGQYQLRLQAFTVHRRLLDGQERLEYLE